MVTLQNWLAGKFQTSETLIFRARKSRAGIEPARQPMPSGGRLDVVMIVHSLADGLLPDKTELHGYYGFDQFADQVPVKFTELKLHPGMPLKSL